LVSRVPTRTTVGSVTDPPPPAPVGPSREEGTEGGSTGSLT
jgi:hypothetical protein